MSELLYEIRAILALVVIGLAVKLLPDDADATRAHLASAAQALS